MGPAKSGRGKKRAVEGRAAPTAYEEKSLGYSSCGKVKTSKKGILA